MYGSDSKVTLIVTSAGSGKRMGLDYPKQFLLYKEKPLFLSVIEIAEQIKVIDKIIVVTNKNSISYVEELCSDNKFLKVKNVISGGNERQNSVRNALEFCEDNIFIAVQDGVRPFMKEKYFLESLKILKNDNDIDGVVIGTPLKNTIKLVDCDNAVIETPNRNSFMEIQTPQIFKSEILKLAHKKCLQENFLGTDDASLVEKIGGRVKVIIGDYDNIKITTVEDLKFLENK